MPHSLRKLKELGAKATRGEWLYRRQDDASNYYDYIICGPTEHSTPYYVADCHTDEWDAEHAVTQAANAAYIAAHDPQTVAALIAVVEAAQICLALRDKQLLMSDDWNELREALQEFTP